MAEFGLQATQLQEGKGEGARVLSPVQSPQISGNPVLPFIESAVNIFSKGLKQNAQAEQERLENEIVNRYVRDQNKLSSAVDNNGMTAREAGARSRALFTEYINNNPGLEDKLKKAADTLRGNTALGIVEEEEKGKRDQRRNDIAAASKDGVIFYPNMSLLAEDSALHTHKQGIIEKQRLDAFYRAREFEMKSTTFDQAQSDRELKNLTEDILHKAASSNVSDFAIMGKDLGDKVRSGKLKPEEAQALLAERMSRIGAGIASGAASAPGLASAYKGVFDKLYEANLKMIDPKAMSEDASAQVTSLIKQAQLIAMQRDRKLLGFAAVEGIIPTIAPSLLQGSKTAMDAVLTIANTPIYESDKIPSIVGGYDPKAEEETLDQLKKALKPVTKGNKELAELQQAQSVNHILKQTGDLLDKGKVTPEKLEPVAKFIASSQFGEWASKKKFDPDLAIVAARTLQMYEEAAISSVNNILQKPLNKVEPFGMALAGSLILKNEAPEKQKTLMQSVDVTFSGGGITITPKKVDSNLQRSQSVNLEEVKKAAAGINMLIKLRAHGEGSLDYAKVWEENKHLFLPGMFGAPKSDGVKPVNAKTEANMREAVKLTPAEQKREDERERSASNIKELKEAIKNAPSKYARDILEAELKRLGG